MCFSINVNLVKEELEKRYGVNFPDKYPYDPSYYYHAFSLPEIPAICSDNPQTIRLLKWGLIPSWIKSEEKAAEIRLKTFNARVESIGQKASFSLSFKSKRCLVPVKGFYEWQHSDKLKIPWYVTYTESDIFSLAGLFSEWSDSRRGELVSTFTIITTEANELMAYIHNSKKRMPVILNRQDELKWLDLSVQQEEALSLLKACPSELLKAHTIGPLIKDRSANKNTPEIIREYSWENNNTLF